MKSKCPVINLRCICENPIRKQKYFNWIFWGNWYKTYGHPILSNLKHNRLNSNFSNGFVYKKALIRTFHTRFLTTQ